MYAIRSYYGRAIALQASHIAQHLALGVGLLQLVQQDIVQLAEPLHKLLRLHRLEARRHQPLEADVLRLQLKARLPGQDQQLAPHVLAGEILPGIRLGETPLPGPFHQGGEGHSAIVLLEQSYNFV